MIFNKEWRMNYKIKHAENNYKFTNRGLYQMQYYIDKYINEKEIDSIESYEETLRQMDEESSTIKIYNAFFPNDIDDKQKLHIFSTICFIIITLYTLNEDEEIEVLSWIEPERVDDFILISKIIKETFILK